MDRYEKFFSGYEMEAYDLFGCHKKGNGVEFTLWAPHAYRVQVFTSREDFSRFYDLNKVDDRGIWQLYIEDMEIIYLYRYRIWKDDHTFQDKSDPYAFAFEKRPGNCSAMYDLDYFSFSDEEYMGKRSFSYDQALNIYEVHLNGFRKKGDLATYREVKESLIPYVKDMGFTHIELMPVFEHPFDGSWGYQASGFFAATSRYGTPYDLMDLINECHRNGIGVLLDAVYVHFAKDAFCLGNFDFTPLYEYKEGRLAHSEWGTYCFDLTSPPVISFLLSSADFLFNRFHADGLRFDAVSHFIFHHGNKQLGENKPGTDFLKRLNYHLKEKYPSCLLIAEDSTDYPNVTKPVQYGGLGFDYKWDLGWMNDTLKYYAMDPIYRQYHHDLITFSMSYCFSEKFILPFSHDEVVHSKKTIIDKMFGKYEDKFPQCRNLFVYMFTHPGKKLNFMGNEIAMFREFDERKEMDWFMLEYPLHDSFKRFFHDLSHIYTQYPAFYENEFCWENFKWIMVDNKDQSLFVYTREDEHSLFLIVLNMLPVSYKNYRIGVPEKGTYTEILNTEKDIYSGCNMCNSTPRKSVHEKSDGKKDSIYIDIAPYSAIIFRKRRIHKKK